MGTSLRLLMLEDDPFDAELSIGALTDAGYECTWERVETRQEFVQRIERLDYDVVLADYNLPTFDGISALRLFLERRIDRPFILVSGNLGEETAIESLKAGATDYVLKSRLSRLGLAVKRALREKEEERRRRFSEAALNASEGKYKTLFACSADPILIIDRETGKFLDSNLAAVARYGYSHEEFLALTPRDLGAPRERGSSALETREDGRDVHLTKGGERIDVEISGAALEYDGRPATISIIRDITRRKLAEDQLRRRNRELALLNRIIAASASGLEPDTILEAVCRELAVAFDVRQALGALRYPGDGPAPALVVEYRADGTPRTAPTSVTLREGESLDWMFGQQTPFAVFDAAHDWHMDAVRHLVTSRGIHSALLIPIVANTQVVGEIALESLEPRRFTEEELELASRVADQLAGAFSRAWLDHERRRLSGAIEQVAESVVITDPNGRVVYANPAFEQMTGFSRAEILGQIARLQEGDWVDPEKGPTRHTMTNAEVWQGRTTSQRKDGTRYTADMTIAPVRNAAGVVVNFVAVQRDVTHEIQLQEQFRQAQKMEAIGRLAGGVAHDFNNLLTAIVGYTQLLLDRAPSGTPMEHDLNQIHSACDRAAALVRSLLTFSRRDSSRPVVLNLNEVVRNVSKLLERVIGEDVQLSYRLPAQVKPVLADPGRIEQVLMNLVVNARDAMPGGGRLTVEVDDATLEEGQTTIANARPGDYVRVSVTDTGVGMDEETLGQIFEPFFTTKPAGQGTGLGLSIVYGVVKQHEGHIAVSSAPGEGTTFHVYFPVHAQATAEGGGPVAQSSAQPRGGKELLLLVEDEDGVRLLVQRALQGLGYRVLTAPNAREAIQLFEQFGPEISMLVTDVVMPDTDGPALFQTLTEERPNLKVLFLSGYTGEIVRSRGLLQGAPFLPKPFALVELARMIRDILDA